MTPIRIQRKRTKGWKMPENTVYVGRGTKFGNPFKIGGWIGEAPFIVLAYANLSDDELSQPINRETSLKLFRAWLDRHYLGIEVFIKAKHELRGKNLACFCPLDKPCHADVLIEIANR